ncbi:hypothetical protein ACFRFJ_26945 [Streptomyces hydrogenans]|uniref:hypothetical protein n=1 Tax=Streptomyces hydrogenans TaxID=1873719 RepID=UPI0036799AB6
MASARDDVHAVDRRSDTAPPERLGRPEDIAGTVAFLAGPARRVNGRTLLADGAPA